MIFAKKGSDQVWLHVELVWPAMLWWAHDYKVSSPVKDWVNFHLTIMTVKYDKRPWTWDCGNMASIKMDDQTSMNLLTQMWILWKLVNDGSHGWKVCAFKCRQQEPDNGPAKADNKVQKRALLLHCADKAVSQNLENPSWHRLHSEIGEGEERFYHSHSKFNLSKSRVLGHLNSKQWCNVWQHNDKC